METCLLSPSRLHFRTCNYAEKVVCSHVYATLLPSKVKQVATFGVTAGERLDGNYFTRDLMDRTVFFVFF